MRPPTGVLLPGEAIRIIVEVRVEAEHVRDIMGRGGLKRINSDLHDTLVLYYGGGDKFLVPKFRLRPTCFGAPLNVLVRLAGPIALEPNERLFALLDRWCGSQVDSVFFHDDVDDTIVQGVPKELHKLVEYLGLHGLEVPNWFQDAGLPEELCIIRDNLDMDPGDQPLDNVNVHAVLEALLLFLKALPDSLMPTAWFKRCAEACDRTTAHHLVLQLPRVNRNCLEYLLAFLQAVLDKAAFNGTNKSLLGELTDSTLFLHSCDATFGLVFAAGYFGDVLLRSKSNEKVKFQDHTWKIKANFVEYFLTESTTASAVAQEVPNLWSWRHVHASLVHVIVIASRQGCG